MEKINKPLDRPLDVPINIKQIIDDAKTDPSLLSTIDINSLLKAIDEKNTDYLQNKTLKDINQDVFDTINEQKCGQGSASFACNLEPPTFGVAVLRAFTPPTTNFKGEGFTGTGGAVKPRSSVDVDELRSSKSMDDDHRSPVGTEGSNLEHLRCSEEKFGDTAREKMIKSLLGYRYVSEIYELHLGKAVQIIKRKDEIPKLIIAGFITNIEFLDNGIYFVCKGFKNRMFKYKFDDCHIFQKLSQNEMLILMAYDKISNDHP